VIDSALSFFRGSELDAATLADRWPISAPPAPMASAMVSDAAGDGDGVALTAGAGSAVPVDCNVGEGEGDAALGTPAVTEGVGAGLDSTAKAAPLRPGPVNKEQTRVMSPKDLRATRRD
jgi:hypothetical protein